MVFSTVFLDEDDPFFSRKRPRVSDLGHQDDLLADAGISSDISLFSHQDIERSSICRHYMIFWLVRPVMLTFIWLNVLIKIVAIHKLLNVLCHSHHRGSIWLYLLLWLFQPVLWFSESINYYLFVILGLLVNGFFLHATVSFQ